MLTSSLFRTLLLAAALGAMTLSARADTISLTDIQGVLIVDTSPGGGAFTARVPPFFSLRGPGFSVSRGGSSGGGDAGNVQARDLCLPAGCAPGTVLATNSTFSGLLAPFTTASASVNGVVYSNAQLTGEFNFTSPDIMVPDSGNIVSITVPFTFTGTLTVVAGQPDVVNPVFTATLSGQGLVTFTFVEVTRGSSNPRYMLNSATYRFETPEPVTLLLLGTGLAGVAVRVRRRRKRGDDVTGPRCR